MKASGGARARAGAESEKVAIGAFRHVLFNLVSSDRWVIGLCLWLQNVNVACAEDAEDDCSTNGDR